MRQLWKRSGSSRADLTASLLVPLALVGMLGACSGLEGEQSYPIEDNHARKMRHGRIGGEGGLTLFGPGSGSGGGGMIGVNSYLWRATLDTLAFLPVTSADPFGGTVLTDWYESPDAPGERIKVNATIMGGQLRADGIRVSVFRQVQEGGQWRSAPVNADVPRQMEDAILTKARSLRVADGK